MSGLVKYYVTGVGLWDKDDPKFPMRQVYKAEDVARVFIPFLETFIACGYGERKAEAQRLLAGLEQHE